MIRFIIRPEIGKKDYYIVKIYDSIQDMRKRYVDMVSMFNRNAEKESQRVLACTFGYSGKAFDVKHNHNQSGEIIFFRRGVTHETVSHEMAHALTYHMVKYRKSFVPSNIKQNNWAMKNEWHADSLGYMVGQFWKKYMKYIK